MPRSILIGLDTSVSGIAAQELGIQWARRHGARLVGMAIVDDPGIGPSGGVRCADKHHRAAGAALVVEARGEVGRALRHVLRHFTQRCEEAGAGCRTSEALGTPYVEVLREAQQHDLILLGQHAHLEARGEPGGGRALGRILRDSPRPVVSVPDTVAWGESVIVAYDGSLQAAKALYAFEASGLGRTRETHVVCADADRRSAARRSQRAVEFLRAHGTEAHLHLVDLALTPAEVLLKTSRRLQAGLLVMRAYGEPAPREVYLGSTTRTMLETSPAPVFLYH